MLTMIHPDIETSAKVIDAGVFNSVWAARGWVLLGPAETYATEVLGTTVKKVEDLKVTELRALISTRAGQDFPATGVLKPELIEIFRGTFPEQSPAEVEAVEVAVDAGLPVVVPVVVDSVDPDAPADPDPTAPVTVTTTANKKKD